MFPVHESNPSVLGSAVTGQSGFNLRRELRRAIYETKFGWHVPEPAAKGVVGSRIVHRAHRRKLWLRSELSRAGVPPE
jgi:hypothetical protein